MSARDDQRIFLMGQRVSLSFLDTKLANLAYQCADNCNPKPVCENEGYANQFCVCTCPDGFYGNRCQYLQGYSGNNSKKILRQVYDITKENIIYLASAVQSRLAERPSTTTTTTTKTTVSTTKKTICMLFNVRQILHYSTFIFLLLAENVLRWLEWTDWSNCSEACGSGIRVRTRLCSNTTIDGSTDPCASLGGSSFEIEACQNSQCQRRLKGKSICMNKTEQRISFFLQNLMSFLVAHSI